MIVLGTANLQTVLETYFFSSLCLKERPKWKLKQARFFFVYAANLLYKSGAGMVARKPAFLHHLRGKQNYQALFVYRSDLGANYLIYRFSQG